jgi:23S rRNA (pseudouridine1915-N3)-methyltransferase
MLRLILLAAANRQPDWVDTGFREYAGRLRGRCTLELVTTALARRTASTPAERAAAEEGARLLKRVPSGAHLVALTERGQPWTTRQLADRLERWMQRGVPVCLLVGGPDGLSSECAARAAEHWSLSPLTLPHGLVRVVAAEALYRAWSLLEGHPYHRA